MLKKVPSSRSRQALDLTVLSETAFSESRIIVSEGVFSFAALQ